MPRLLIIYVLLLITSLTAGVTGGVMSEVGSAPNDVTRLPNKGTDVLNRAKFVAVDTATNTVADVAVHNKSLGGSLVDNLRKNVGGQVQSGLANMIGDGRLNGQISQPEQLGLHAGASGIAALIKNADPWAAMVAAPVSEAAAEAAFMQSFSPETSANIGKIVGTITGLPTGNVGDASDSAIIAIDNNFLPMAIQLRRTCAMNPACASLVRDGMAIGAAAAMTIYKKADQNVEGFDIADVASKLPGFTPEASEVSVLTTPAHQEGAKTLATPEHTYDPEINTEGFSAVSEWLKHATTILFNNDAATQEILRPSAKQSEIDVGKDLGGLAEPQKSFKGQDGAKYGAKGSVRPDYCIGNLCSIEVKNYDINKNSSKLIDNVAKQAIKRSQELPEGMVQEVHIDVRGQKYTAEQLDVIKDKIVQKSNGLIAENKIKFIEVKKSE